MVKPRLYNNEDTTKAAALWTLKTVLIQALKLLHPYMPFITEEIFCNVQSDEASIMVSSWPEYREAWRKTRYRYIKPSLKAVSHSACLSPSACSPRRYSPPARGSFLYQKVIYENLNGRSTSFSSVHLLHYVNITELV